MNRGGDVAVVAIRSDERRVLFARFPDEATARDTIAALARLGLRAEIRRNVPSSLRPGSNLTAGAR